MPEFAQLAVFTFLLYASFILTVSGQDDSKSCQTNQLFNGQNCVCLTGYYMSSDNSSKTRCDTECDDQYFSFFTYGDCVSVKPANGNEKSKDAQKCNLKCAFRLRIITIIGIFAVFVAALATIMCTIPMCIATCASCLHSKNASKHSKRIYAENQQPNKDQQLAAMSYNPYAYWPYYGR